MNQSGNHLRGVMLAAGGMLLISPDGLMFRLVAASDLQILFWRSLISGLALGLYIQFTTKGGAKAAFVTSGWAGALASVLIAAGTIFFVTSITRTTVANTLVILATVPLVGAALGWLVLRERVKLGTWLAMGAAFAGIAIIFADAIGRGDILGNALAIGTALAIGGNLVVIRARTHISVLPALALSTVLIAVAVAPFIDTFAVSWHDFGLIAIMGVVFQSLAFAMFLAAARYLPAPEVGLFALLETVLGPLWAWGGVGEIPTTSALVGGALVVATLALHSALSLRRSRTVGASGAKNCYPRPREDGT